MTYPSGRVYSYGYNNAGEITSLVDSARGINFFTGGQYAPPGLLIGGIHGAVTGWNAITLANSYNNRLQPTHFLATSPVPSTLLDLSYAYDQGSGKNNGSVVQIANGRDSARSVQYTYDQVNRLSTAGTYNATTWGDSYVYDAWGNLLQKNMTQTTGETLTMLVNNKNWVTTPRFSYDADGDVTSDGTLTMTYDAEGRMITAVGGSVNDTYTYDGDGRRVKKSDGTFYWVDDSFRPLSIGTSTALTKDFVFLGGQRIAFVSLSSGNPYYYLSDHLGSTAVIASGDGKAIDWEADYYPFGNQRHVFTSSVNNPYQFTGYEYDSDTGYDYAVARFEAGRWSRFMSPDPFIGSMDLGNPQSLNRYAYVGNDAVNFVDPLGLRQQKICMLDDNGNDTNVCVTGAGFLDDPFEHDAGSLGGGPLNYVPGIGFIFPGPGGFSASIGGLGGDGYASCFGDDCLQIPFLTLGGELNNFLSGLPWNNPCILSPISDGCAGSGEVGNEFAGLKQTFCGTKIVGKTLNSDLNPFSASATTLVDPTLKFIADYYRSLAFAHSAARALSYPFKSSIVRRLLANGSKVEAAAPLVALDIALLHGVINESIGIRQGKCD